MSKLFGVTATVLVLLMPLILPFQNCGDMGEGFESSSSEAWDTLVIEPKDPMGEDHDAQKVTETKYEANLVDRYYLSSLIVDVFGPTAPAVDSSKISSKGEEWGGPCSIYVHHRKPAESIGGLVNADEMEVCAFNTSNFLSAKFNPDPTLIRQALLTRACSDLTTNNTTLGFALNQLGSPTAVPEVNEQTVLKLLKLFYRGHIQPDQSVQEAIMAMFPAQGVTREHWRSALYTVCASGYWQVN